jgi:hypothetical protein
VCVYVYVNISVFERLCVARTGERERGRGRENKKKEKRKRKKKRERGGRELICSSFDLLKRFIYHIPIVVDRFKRVFDPTDLQP